jgi:homopolymeric O-antigen transport system permease protein
MSTPVAESPPVVSPLTGPEPPELAETIVAPSRGWQLINCRELWQFRELLWSLTQRDVKVRYKQTFLGAAWAVLQPAMMMVVFTIFFGKIGKLSASSGDSFKDTLDYALFACAGLIAWTFFANAIGNAGQSVLGSERLITKIYFPRLALPFASVLAALVDCLISFGLLFVVMVVSACYGGQWQLPSWQFLLVPVILAVITVGAMGVGTLLAGLHVAYRDFRYVTPFMVQLWMFATPTLYNQTPPGAETGWVALAMTCNPMTGLVASFRAACLGAEIPWLSLGISTATMALLFVLGCCYFRKVEDWFADII